MCKVCYICGKKIDINAPYYCIGVNTYVCDNNECYNTYWWDKTAAAFVVDNKHQYVVAENGLYSIEDDGVGGDHFIIEFFDGVRRETNSLWFMATIPENKKHIFKENARFVIK